MIKNLVFLMLTQGIAFLVPLILLPVFSSSFEKAVFTDVIFYISLVQLGYMVAEFGFNIIIPAKIVGVKSSRKIKRLNSSILVSKLIIVLIYSIFIFLLFDISIYVIIFLFGTVYFQAIQFQWVYISNEMFKSLAVINIYNKALYIPLFFLLNTFSFGGFSVYISIFLSQFIVFLYTLKNNKLARFDRVIFLCALNELVKSLPYFINRLYSFGQYFTLMPMVSVLNAQLLNVAAYLDPLLKAGRGAVGVLPQVAYPFFMRRKGINSQFFIFFVISNLVLAISLFISLLFLPTLYELLFPSLGIDLTGYSVFIVLCVYFTFNAAILGYPAFALFNEIEQCRKTAKVGFFIFALCFIFLYVIDEPGIVQFLMAQIIADLSLIIIRAVKVFKFLNKGDKIEL